MVELNVQIDPVRLLVLVPLKVSISNFVGTLKGRTVIHMFNKLRKLKNEPCWGNHFWFREYCVDTVELDEEMVGKCMKYQEKEECRQEQKDDYFDKGWEQLPLPLRKAKVIHPPLGLINAGPSGVGCLFVSFGLALMGIVSVCFAPSSHVLSTAHLAQFYCAERTSWTIRKRIIL